MAFRRATCSAVTLGRGGWFALQRPLGAGAVRACCTLSGSRGLSGKAGKKQLPATTLPPFFITDSTLREGEQFATAEFTTQVSNATHPHPAPSTTTLRSTGHACPCYLCLRTSFLTLVVRHVTVSAASCGRGKVVCVVWPLVATLIATVFATREPTAIRNTARTLHLTSHHSELTPILSTHALTSQDRIYIAKLLSGMGVDYIELVSGVPC
jgi:hypothetical protein